MVGVKIGHIAFLKFITKQTQYTGVNKNLRDSPDGAGYSVEIGQLLVMMAGIFMGGVGIVMQTQKFDETDGLLWVGPVFFIMLD